MIDIITFGFARPEGAPRDAQVIFPMADLFRDPAHNPDLVKLTGLDAPVIKSVRDRPNYWQHLNIAFATVVTLVSIWGDVRVAVGCVGGLHRSVVFGNDLYEKIAIETTQLVKLTHRDVTKGLIER